MVLDLLTLAVGLPTAAGVSTAVSTAVSEAVRQQDREKTDRDQEWCMREFHLDVFCSARSRKRNQVDGSMVVLRDGKLWLAPKDPATKLPLPIQGQAMALHPFTGFYLDYVGEKPDADPMFERLNRAPKTRGLVTTIAREPATLNLVYVDRNTQEVRYGRREEAKGHILGPFGWTEDETGLTLQQWEGFVAVEERKDVWAVYYDRDDDGLRDIVFKTRVLQCSLERRVIDDRPVDDRVFGSGERKSPGQT